MLIEGNGFRLCIPLLPTLLYTEIMLLKVAMLQMIKRKKGCDSLGFFYFEVNAQFKEMVRKFSGLSMRVGTGGDLSRKVLFAIRTAADLCIEN